MPKDENVYLASSKIWQTRPESNRRGQICVSSRREETAVLPWNDAYEEYMAAGPAPAHRPGVSSAPRRPVSDHGGTQHREPPRRIVQRVISPRGAYPIGPTAIAQRESAMIITVDADVSAGPRTLVRQEGLDGLRIRVVARLYVTGHGWNGRSTQRTSAWTLSFPIWTGN